MRLRPVLVVASLVLVPLSAAACSSGSTTSVATSSTSAQSSSSAAADSTTGSADASAAPSAAAFGAPSGVNVCSLLSVAQASSITGAPYTTTTPSYGAGGNTCLYKVSTGTPMLVTVVSNAGSSAAWTEELSTLQLGGGETPVTISGVGDRAATSTGSLGTQSGTWIIQVDNGDSTSTGGGFTKSIAVAKAIIGALY